jgi:hypothetical protein
MQAGIFIQSQVIALCQDIADSMDIGGGIDTIVHEYF